MRRTDALKLSTLVIAALFIVAMTALYRRPVEPERHVTGVVTAIMPSQTGRFHTPGIYIEVRAANAMIGEARVPFDDSRCHVGDRIEAVQTGIAIRPDPASCVSPTH